MNNEKQSQKRNDILRWTEQLTGVLRMLMRNVLDANTSILRWQDIADILESVSKQIRERDMRGDLN